MSATEAPQNIVIFASIGVDALEVASVMDVFNEANAQADPAVLYEPTLVAEQWDAIRCTSACRIIPDRSIAEPLHDADTVLVAGSYDVPAPPSEAGIVWLQQRSASASPVSHSSSVPCFP